VDENSKTFAESFGEFCAQNHVMAKMVFDISLEDCNRKIKVLFGCHLNLPKILLSGLFEKKYSIFAKFQFLREL